MGKFSRQQIDDISLIFSRKYDKISCKLYPKKTICMKCQPNFLGANKKKKGKKRKNISECYQLKFEGWAQDYNSNSNIFLKPLFRGNFDPFINNANLGAIAHTSNGT